MSREAWLLSVLWIQLPRERVIITTTFWGEKKKHCLKVLSKAEQCRDSVTLHANLLGRQQRLLYAQRHCAVLHSTEDHRPRLARWGPRVVSRAMRRPLTGFWQSCSREQSPREHTDPLPPPRAGLRLRSKGVSSTVQLSVRWFSRLWSIRHREEVTPEAKERGLLRPVCPRRYAVSVMMIRSSRSVKVSPCGIIPSLNLPWFLCYSQPAARIMLLPVLVPWLQGHGGPKGDLVETSKTQRQVFHCSSGEGAPLTFPTAQGALAGPGASAGLLAANSLGITCSHAGLTSPTEKQLLKHLMMKT